MVYEKVEEGSSMTWVMHLVCLHVRFTLSKDSNH